MFILSILGTLVLTQVQAETLWEGTGFRATVYYDLTQEAPCDVKNGGPFPDDWAPTSINMGVPWCNDNTDGRSLDDFGTNRIVALNHTMIKADREKYCGKEVEIIDPNGEKVTIPEGPFVLWDVCDAAMTTKIVDLSAIGFVAASPDKKCGNNPEGFTVRILDNDLRAELKLTPGLAAAAPSSPATESATAEGGEAESAAAEGGEAVSAVAAAGGADAADTTDEDCVEEEEVVAADDEDCIEDEGSAGSTASTASQGGNAPAPAAAAPPAPPEDIIPADCTYGEYHCDGGKIQICDYVTSHPPTYGWQKVGQCPKICVIEDGTPNCTV